MAIKRTARSPQYKDYFLKDETNYYEDDVWDLGQLAGEGRGDTGSGGRSPIPMEPRKIPVFVSGAILSPVAQPTPRVSTTRVPQSPPGTVPAPVPPQLPPVFTPGPLSTQENDMSLDLGNIVTGVAGAYFDAKYNPGQIRTVANQPTYGTGGMDGSVLPTTPVDAGIPFVDVIPEPPSDSCGGQYLWKPATATCAGKWIKRSRRRRRKLVTDSDIKGIAALRTVGGPSLVKTWIATHST